MAASILNQISLILARGLGLVSAVPLIYFGVATSSAYAGEVKVRRPKRISTPCGEALYFKDGDILSPIFGQPRQPRQSGVFQPGPAMPLWLLDVESPFEVLQQQGVVETKGQFGDLTGGRESLISYMSLLGDYVVDRSSRESILLMSQEQVRMLVNMLTTFETLRFHLPGRAEDVFSRDVKAAAHRLLEDSSDFLLQVEVLINESKVPALNSFADRQFSSSELEPLVTARGRLSELRYKLANYRRIARESRDDTRKRPELLSAALEVLPAISGVLSQYSTFFIQLRYSTNILRYDLGPIQNEIHELAEFIENGTFADLLVRAKLSSDPDVAAIVGSYNDSLQRFNYLAIAFENPNQVTYLMGY